MVLFNSTVSSKTLEHMIVEKKGGKVERASY